MSYYIQPSGSYAELTDGSWTNQTPYVPPFETLDCFRFSSAPISYSAWTGASGTYEPGPFGRRMGYPDDGVIGIDIVTFSGDASISQRVSMGCYQSSSVCRDKVTNHLWLCIPQTGGCVYFRIYES